MYSVVYVRETDAAEADGENESEYKDENGECYQQPPDPPVTRPLVSRQRRVATLQYIAQQHTHIRLPFSFYTMLDYREMPMGYNVQVNRERWPLNILNIRYRINQK